MKYYTKMVVSCSVLYATTFLCAMNKNHSGLDCLESNFKEGIQSVLDALPAEDRILYERIKNEYGNQLVLFIATNYSEAKSWEAPKERFFIRTLFAKAKSGNDASWEDHNYNGWHSAFKHFDMETVTKLIEDQRHKLDQIVTHNTFYDWIQKTLNKIGKDLADTY